MVERTVLTYDGLQAAPDDGLRRELLGGDLYVSPAPAPHHQFVVAELIMVLGDYAKRNGGRVLPSPIDVVFSQIDAVQPDIVYFTTERLGIIGPKNIQGSPSLLVEVLSPSSSDIDPGRKLQMYATHGVPEYWIVDPSTRTGIAHADPSGERYLRTAASIDAVLRALTLERLAFTIPPT